MMRKTQRKPKSVAATVLCLLFAASGVVPALDQRSSPPASPPVERPDRPAPSPPVAPAPPSPQVEREVTYSRWPRPMVRIWQHLTLRADMVARDVVVIAGDATIEGRIDGDLVVVLGHTRLAPTAVVRGVVVSVAGDVTAEAGATVRDDLVVVGGVLKAPPEFSPGGNHVVVGARLGDYLRSAVPWLTRGLLMGRLIVPDLSWIWKVVAVVVILTLLINLVLHDPIGRCADVLAKRPFSTFLTGLLVLLVTGPISLILAASIVGLAVVPFVICAVIVAWIVGRIAVTRWIGRSVTGQAPPETRLQATASVSIGLALVLVLYAVPILGLATWAIVGVFGLGAATLTFLEAVRRERPKRVAVTPPPAAPPDATPPVPPPASPPPSPLPPTPPPVPVDVVPPPRPAAAFSSAAVAVGDAAGVTDLTLLPRATLADRAAAGGLDIVLVLIVLALLNLRDAEDVAPVFFFLYFVLMWAWKGTTVGGIICNLRIVRTDGAAMRPGDALVRAFASLFSLGALGLGFLWILRDPERQAWHDRIAGTYVVKVPREWPIP